MIYLVEFNSGKLLSGETQDVPDVMNYCGFIALKNIMLAILTSLDNDTTKMTDETNFSDLIAAAKTQLSHLLPLTYRLEIIEDAFSLLFARTEHLSTFQGSSTSFSGSIIHSRQDRPDTSDLTDSEGCRKKKDGSETGLKSESSGFDDHHHPSHLASEKTVPERTRSERFLVSAGVIKELLTTLVDCVNDVVICAQDSSLSVEVLCGTNFKSDAVLGIRERFHERCARIQNYLENSLWRWNIVSLGSFQSHCSSISTSSFESDKSPGNME